MPLPIDTEAIAAQTKAEHEYGERLMTVAESLAMVDGADSVKPEHIERAAKIILGTMAEGAGCDDSELPSLLGYCG